MVAIATPTGIISLNWQLKEKEMAASYICQKSMAHLELAEKWLNIYFNEEKTREFPDISLDFSNLTPFRQLISEALMENITWGKTITYGELATLSDRAGSSRAVGTTMAKNPWSLIVPCHRVVKSDGRLGNYSAADGVNTKKWLLNHESKSV